MGQGTEFDFVTKPVAAEDSAFRLCRESAVAAASFGSASTILIYAFFTDTTKFWVTSSRIYRSAAPTREPAPGCHQFTQPQRQFINLIPERRQFYGGGTDFIFAGYSLHLDQKPARLLPPGERYFGLAGRPGRDG
ncbi:MAG: hypothetical protein P8J29_10065 [Rhodospirillales bacterium]|nr:hypothetical protein [Rhodospirillales bacterium]